MRWSVDLIGIDNFLSCFFLFIVLPFPSERNQYSSAFIRVWVILFIMDYQVLIERSYLLIFCVDDHLLLIEESPSYRVYYLITFFLLITSTIMHSMPTAFLNKRCCYTTPHHCFEKNLQKDCYRPSAGVQCMFFIFYLVLYALQQHVQLVMGECAPSSAE